MYHNPFHIFPELREEIIDSSDVNALKKLKKIYLSKLELNPSGTLIINAKKYGKNDLLILFDGLQDLNILSAYKELYQNKELELFLQKESFNKNLDISSLSSYSLNLIKENIVQSFRFFANKYYHSSYITPLQECAHCSLFQNESLSSSLNQVIFQICEEHSEDLEQMENECLLGNYPTQNDISPIISKEWTNFYNSLDSDFDLNSNNYAIRSINISAEMFNNARKEKAKYIIKSVRNLKCESENEKLIRLNYKVMNESNFSGSYNVLWFIGIIFLKFVLFSGRTGCNSRSNTIENNYYIKELNEGEQKTILIDQLKALDTAGYDSINKAYYEEELRKAQSTE